MALWVLTAFGLLSALLGQHGIWYGLSWLALAAPLVAVGAVISRTVAAVRRRAVSLRSTGA